MSFQSSINQLLAIAAVARKFGQTQPATTNQAPNPAEQKSMQKTAEIQQTKTKQNQMFKDYD